MADQKNDPADGTTSTGADDAMLEMNQLRNQISQLQSDLAIAKESLAAAAQTASSSSKMNPDVIDATVKSWFHSLSGSALSRSTEAYNFVAGALPRLVDALVREQ